MAANESKEIQVKGKQEASVPAEQTRPGVVFTPDVDIFEKETELTLLADMPGVKTGDIVIDLRDDVLTISGEVSPQRGSSEEQVLIEYETGKFYRQFTLSEVIDQEKINARMTDGVLRLNLPKVEKATPRKITVQGV